jgi:hypothetical protein
MKLRGHIMSSITQAVLEAADAWATAVEREAAAQEFNQNDDDAAEARSSAEVNLIAAVKNWRQEGGLSQ